MLMTWKECSVIDERLRFVAGLLDGKAMTDVCRAFGISRKTGYKIFERYKEHGLEALTDRSRRVSCSCVKPLNSRGSRIEGCRPMCILRGCPIAPSSEGFGP